MKVFTTGSVGGSGIRAVHRPEALKNQLTRFPEWAIAAGAAGEIGKPIGQASAGVLFGASEKRSRDTDRVSLAIVGVWNRPAVVSDLRCARPELMERLHPVAAQDPETLVQRHVHMPADLLFAVFLRAGAC